jgi:hypothetical protein
MIGGAMVLGAAASMQRWGTTDVQDSLVQEN